MTHARQQTSVRHEVVPVGRWGWHVFWLGVANCLALPIAVAGMGKGPNALFLIFAASLVVSFAGGLTDLVLRWRSRYAADELAFFLAPYCLASLLALGAIALVTAAALAISNAAPSAPAWLFGGLLTLFLFLLALAVSRRLRSN